VRFAGAALQALSTGHVHLGGDKIAFLDARDFIAERNDLAAKFVARESAADECVPAPSDPTRRYERSVPQIEATLTLDQNVVASVAGNSDLAEFRSWRGF